MAAEKFVSLRPSDMVQGGLIDDVDVEFVEAAFVLFDYNGKADPRTALKLVMKDDDDNLHEQFFTAADPKHFVPSSDGNHVVASGEKGALNRGSNYDLFITSLVNAGYPEPELDKGAGGLVGVKAHVLRKPAPKRSGIITAEGDREKTVLEVSRLISLPGESKGKKAAPKAAPKVNGKTAAAAKSQQDTSGDLDTDLQQLVIEALAENDGSIEKRQLVPFVFRKAQGPAKKAMVKRVAEDDFLIAGMGDGLWNYDDDTVTAA